jgi:hypothetical protein
MAAGTKARNQYSDKRPIRIEGDIAYVPLTQGREAIIDAEDAEDVGRYGWFCSVHKGKPYARRNTRREDGTKYGVYLHRDLISDAGDLDIDHINGDGLDNRRSNLRLATRSQNMMNAKTVATNSSGYRGVSWQKSKRKWRATICVSGRKTYLGDFKDIEEANAAYVSASLRLHGVFSPFAAEPA